MVWTYVLAATDKDSGGGVSWYWTLFALLLLGALLTIAYDHLSGRAKERRELRRTAVERAMPSPRDRS